MNDPNNTQDHTQIACTTCNYNLTGLDLAGDCPECGNLILQTCFHCDYELVGIDPTSPCPECGFPVKDSIGHGPLTRSSPENIATLHKGVFLVQAAVIVWILNIFAGAIMGGIAGAKGIPLSTTANTVLGIILAGISVTFILGWWKLSSAEQANPESPAGHSAKRFLRVMLIIFAVVTAANLLSNLIPQSFYNTVAGGIAALVFLLIALGVTVTLFIAQLLYIQWMAPLIRNKKVLRRSKTLVWLGPVLMTVGALILIGPLIAIILYWNMLDWIRKDLKSIRQSHHAIA